MSSMDRGQAFSNEHGERTREELAGDLEKSRSEIARLKKIIAGQQKILDTRKALPAKGNGREARPECADTLEKELIEKQRVLEALNEDLEIHVEELSTQNEELLDTREALMKTEEKFRALFERAGVAIFMADAKTGEIIDCNPKAEELIGRRREEVVGLHQTWLHPSEMAAERRETFAHNAQKDFISNFETVVQHRDGRVFPVDITASYVEYDGKAYSFCFVRDITERKRTDEERKAAKQQAELYLDLMGHDINNMHQIALGYLELARDMPPGEAQTSFLNKSVEVLQRSAQLIQNVRKLQKLRDGVFQTQDVDVCKVLSDVRREFGAVPSKLVTLNFNECDCCFVLANELLHDVFANLVSNAIKHTGGRAEIVIDLDVINDNGYRYCRVFVEDNGPGVPDEFKAKIFDRTLKGTNNAKGMGLGLYLVKSLVDSYGGRVWVEDRVFGDHTKGARFAVMLPAVDK